MANEQISIEITDKVSSTVATKINRIGVEAEISFNQVQKLQKALSGLKSNAMDAISSVSNRASVAMDKAATASQRLATEQAKTATAAANAARAQAQATAAQTAGATAAQKLATEQQRTAAATTQAATAATQAATAAAKLQAAQDAAAGAALRLQQAQDRATARTQAQALAAANAATTAAQLATANTKGAAAADKYVMSAKAQAAAMRGVPAQITDIVVSLQGGQRPLTVLLQQGGQLKDMFGGIVPALRALAAGLIAMVTPVTVIIAAFAAFAAVMAMVESRMREINGIVAQFMATGRNLDGTWVVALRKELEQLPGVSKSAAMEIISAFAQVRNVGGENLKAASKIVNDLATAMGVDIKTASATFAKALDDPLKGAIELDKQLGFLTVSQFKQIDALMKAGQTAKAQKVLIDALAGSISGLTNDAMTPMQKATNDLGNAWNKFTGDLNNSGPIKTATEMLIGLISTLTKLLEKLNGITSWTPPDWVSKVWDAGSQAINPVGSLAGRFLQTEGKAKMSMPPASPIVGTPIANRARTREQNLPTDRKLIQAGIKKDPDAGKAESRAAALLKVNTQLENELKLQNMLGPEREKAQKFDAIEEQMIGKKIKLTASETAAIKDRIAAIVNNAEKAAAMQKIYDDAKGPQREWNAIIEASSQLLKDGRISQDEYNRAMLKGEEVISNIKDPLRQLNKDLAQQLQLSKMTSEAAAIEQQVMQVRNDLLTKGIELDTQAEAKIRAKLKAIQDSNLAQAAENALLAESVNKRRDFTTQLDAINKLRNDSKSGFTAGDTAEKTNDILKSMGLNTSNLQVAADANVAVIQRMYDQVNQLLQKNLIDEQTAANLRTQIWIKSQEQQIAQAQGFFGSLAGLASSGNKKLATIGKAAAISNAIIDTYKSATGAYAAMSSIPYVGPALGAAAAAAAIAAGMANVQAIRSQGTTGFQSGGYTGDFGRSTPAGVVHGQEVVMSAPAVDSIGRANLETMNKTGKIPEKASSNSSSGSQQPSNIRIINTLDPAMVGDFLGTPEGEQLFVNTIRKNADSLRATFANG